MTKQVRQLDRVVIRFAGDSGDGMQLTGDRFTSETAQLGNDISTLPNFPAEIRAPAGTLPVMLCSSTGRSQSIAGLVLHDISRPAVTQQGSSLLQVTVQVLDDAVDRRLLDVIDDVIASRSPLRVDVAMDGVVP